MEKWSSEKNPCAWWRQHFSSETELEVKAAPPHEH